MILTTHKGQTFDTEKDLTAPERHVLQKLLIWELMASSLEEFRHKKQEALTRGWNHSGPVRGSEALKTILADLEEKLIIKYHLNCGSHA